MKQAFITLLALATAAAALPSHAARLHQRAFRNGTGDDVSAWDNIDWAHGTCGGNTGYVCQSGYCCSQYGYCGTGAEYCGGGGATCTSPRLYQGDGSTGAGWPAAEAWASFDNLWNANAGTIAISCNQFGQANNSPTETAQMKNAILSIAASSGVDARFILVTVMQESKGCVRVWTSYGAHPNPGLMQDHNGQYTCYGTNPCPESYIQGMIREGTTGTSSGDGLLQILNKLSTSGARKTYQAARVYNSGSLPGDGNLSNGGATNSYPSDIANRLLGCVF
ncbi:hypothetical protein B0H66DRAFT_168391 [Apodospora peruviana]|uniref:Chitin-binding type-1 domain-containing protein n=1 Tax=Apodospora peruviana TaxID=516989 RepID=A0AAE0IKE8_9PEZI|nr:hypothetical protein B0H66DRAFT_168391 [Apodospora peruviana]